MLGQGSTTPVTGPLCQVVAAGGQTGWWQLFGPPQLPQPQDTASGTAASAPHSLPCPSPRHGISVGTLHRPGTMVGTSHT